MNEHLDIFSWLEWIIIRSALIMLLIIGLGTVLVEATRFLIEKIKTLRTKSE